MNNKFGLIKENSYWVLLFLSIICLFFSNPNIQDLLPFKGSDGVYSFQDRCSMVTYSLGLFVLFFLLANIVYYRKQIWSFITQDNIHLFSSCLFFLLLFTYHLSIKHFGDDLAFQHFIDAQSITDFLAFRYHNFTSRIVIEPFVVAMANNNFLWSLFDSIFILFTFEVILLLTFPRDYYKYSFIVFLLFFLIPTMVLNDAGWTATSLNYTWPFAGMLFIVLLLKKLQEGLPTSVFEKVSLVLVTIFAANVEITAALLFAYCILFMGYKCYTSGKTIKDSILTLDRTYFLIIGISILSFLFIFTCSGNTSRLALEQSLWYPTYGDLSLLDKIELGVISTFPFLYSPGLDYPYNLMLLILIVILLIVLCSKHKYKKTLLVLPSILIISIFDIYPLFVIHIKHQIVSLKYLFFSNIHILNFTGIPQPTRDFGVTSYYLILETVVFLIAFILLLYAVYSAFDNKFTGALCVIILCSGLATRIIMGFSSTVYASGGRTFLFFCYAIIFVLSFLLTAWECSWDKKILTATITAFALLFCYIYRTAGGIL